MHPGTRVSNSHDFVALQVDSNYREKPVLTKSIKMSILPTTFFFSFFFKLITLMAYTYIFSTFSLARHQSAQMLKPLCCSE